VAESVREENDDDPNYTSGFSDSAGTDAAGADSHTLGGLAYDDPNLLKVGIPAPSRQIVGMTDPVPIYRAFVTDFTTLCHQANLLAK
jgi:hypothetical protein